MSPRLLTFCLCLLGACLPLGTLRAQFTWTGNSTNNGAITDALNWGGSAPAGSGSENLTFGTSGAQINVLVGTSAFNNVTFAVGRPIYTFSGLGGSPVLTLNGNVTVAFGNNIAFGSTLGVQLATGFDHVVDVGSGTILQVDGVVTGGGHLAKTGLGTLVLTGANTFNYTGGLGFLNSTVVHAGTLTLNGGAINHGTNGDVYVGENSGDNSMLIVVNGGSVSGYFGVMANGLGSTGTATVSGVGSTWTTSAGMGVGYAGTGTLNVLAGGTVVTPVHVNNADSYIGHGASAVGQATVSGAGSTWTTAAGLDIGHSGSGDLTISSGGAVTNATGYLGFASTGNGSTTVTGTGSTWTNTSYLYVGGAGTGTLAILNGADVLSPNTSIGNNTGGDGTVIIDGAGSTLTNASTLYVGSQGTGLLTVSNGGATTSTDGFIGNNAGGDGYVEVTGPGSIWTNNGNLFVGAAGNGGIGLNTGGEISTLNLTIGNNTGSGGGVTVEDSGTTLAVTSALRVGWQGYGNLYVRSGANASSASGVIGEQAGSSGVVNVYGTGSSLSVSGSDLYVGNGGNGALYLYAQGLLNVGAGAGTLHLGHSAGGDGTLYIGTDGEGYYGGGIINAAAILTGAGTGGMVVLGTTATVAAPYYLTKDGTAAGTAVAINGPTKVSQNGGYNVLGGTSGYTGGTDIFGGTLVATSSGALGTGTVTLNFGTLVVKNTDLYNPLNLLSGRFAGNGYVPLATIGANVVFAPGDLSATIKSVGSFGFDHLELAANGTMEWNLQNPNGAAGIGWDLVEVFTPATLDITATAGSKFTLKLISLDSGGNVGTAAGFNPGQPYSWLMFDTDNIQGFDPTKFTLDTSLFSGDGGAGTFSLTKTGNTLLLNFAPVPEPSTYALILAGLGLAGLGCRRRNRRAP